jgi:hypothetical protein
MSMSAMQVSTPMSREIAQARLWAMLEAPTPPLRR